MNFEIISKQDLEELKNEIVQSIASIDKDVKPRKWLRSKEVRKMLGISPGTLQNFRVNGHIQFTKIGGTLFYDYNEINDVLMKNKSVYPDNVKIA